MRSDFGIICTLCKFLSKVKLSDEMCVPGPEMSTWSCRGEMNYYTTLSAGYMKHTGIITYKEQEKMWTTPTSYCKHQKYH